MVLTSQPKTHPLVRVNLGCGLNAPSGWVNLDRSLNLTIDHHPHLKRALGLLGLLTAAHMAPWPRNIRRHDLRRPLPFGSDSVEAIYSSHTLEHLYLDEAQALLRECRRVLRPGAIIRLALPDGEQLALDLIKGINEGRPDAGMKYNQDLNAHRMSHPSRLASLLSFLASAPHRWQPTIGLAKHLLLEAGFIEIEVCSFRIGSMKDLERLETREMSLFVEARIPSDSLSARTPYLN